MTPAIRWLSHLAILFGGLNAIGLHVLWDGRSDGYARLGFNAFIGWGLAGFGSLLLLLVLLGVAWFKGLWREMLVCTAIAFSFFGAALFAYCNYVFWKSVFESFLS